MGPADVQQLLILILFVVPGVVFQATRSRLRGPTPDDLDASGRVLRALGTSAALAVVYVLIFGDLLTARATGTRLGFGQSPRDEALWAVLLIFVIPATLALLQQIGVVVSRGYRGKSIWPNLWRYDVTPTAWDKASVDRPTCFIRVLTADGRWIGGFAGPESFISGYPQPRDIFLDEAWSMDSKGELKERVTGTIGMWLRCDDARLVQFLEVANNPPPEPDMTTDPPPGTLSREDEGEGRT